MVGERGVTITDGVVIKGAPNTNHQVNTMGLLGSQLGIY